VCNILQVYPALAARGREGEFYPWYALNCLLLNQDCHRVAYTYGVRESEPEVFRIISGLSPEEARALVDLLLERLEREPRISDYVKALAVNHLYLGHEYDDRLLSEEMLGALSRRYGWELIGALLGLAGSVVETNQCIDEPPLIAWVGLREAYRGVWSGREKGEG
jgi:hypothetical protein